MFLPSWRPVCFATKLGNFCSRFSKFCSTQFVRWRCATKRSHGEWHVLLLYVWMYLHIQIFGRVCICECVRICERAYTHKQTQASFCIYLGHCLLVQPVFSACVRGCVLVRAFVCLCLHHIRIYSHVRCYACCAFYFYRWQVANTLFQFSFDALVIYHFGMGPILYLLMSVFWAGSIHPCASHFIAGMYLLTPARV